MPEPVIHIPEELPIAAARAAIEEALGAHQVIVVCGETGSGKSTQLPKIVLGLGRAGVIGHTQPRRIAARSLARRIAEELGEGASELVGYRVRFADHTGPATRIKLMTDGILLAELAHDPQLRRYDTIIIDEAHERSLNIDFLLGYLKRLLPRRPDLKVIIASATLEPQKLSGHFGGAPVIEVSGRGFPIEVRYRPPDGDAAGDLADAIVDAVDEVHASREGARGDALVFLAGEREIREATQALRRHRMDAVEVLPLFSRLSTAEQDRVFHPGARRRIVLATNVAETSLTVPRVTAVIDAGLARVSRYGHRAKIQRLPIEPVSQASAEQRKGRCGRVAPGLCIRLYSEEDLRARPAFTDPEILRTNLASVILRMADLGLGAIEDFEFPDRPDDRLVRDGYRLLRDLQAVDDDQRLTPLGRRMARLPVDPRLARILIAAPDRGCLAEILVLAAVLSIQDPRERPAEQEDAAAREHARFADAASDFDGYLKLWVAYQEERRHGSSRGQRRWCRDRFLSFPRMREWHDLHQELRGIVHDLGLREAKEPASSESVHRALLTGFVDRIGMRELRRGDTARYTGARGLRFRIFPGSGVHGTPRWVMAAGIIDTAVSYAITVARARRAWLEEAGAHLLKRSWSEAHWRIETGRVEAFERSTLYGLQVHAKRRVGYAAVDPAGAHEIFLREALVEGRLGLRAPFLEHNRAEEHEVLALEAKLRRRDMLATTSQRRAAYAARVPPHIADRRAFEAWRRDAERRDPRILYLTRDELLGSDPPAIEPGDFPDRVELEGNALELQYRFEPGAESDGVTIVVPQALLGSVSQAFLDRLVPGHLGEKIEALLRSLPKATRKLLPALRPLAVALASEVRDDPRPLSLAVAEHVRATARIAVDDDLLRKASLSPHLRPRVRVVDRDGRVVAEDRDLPILQSRHAKAGATAVSAPRWERDGMVRFDVDEIAEDVTVQEAGVRLRAWPALEDRGTSVALRPMRSRRAAARATRFGLARLFMLQLPQQAKWISDRIAADPKAALLTRGLGTPAEVGDDLALLVFESVFAPATAPAVRTRADFEALLRERRAGLVDASAAPVAALQRSLELWRVLLARLASSPASWAQAVADMRDQLGALIHPGFLRSMTAEQLRELPRYLQGIAVRLDKLRDAHGRDAGLAAQVRPHWERYRELPEETRAAAEPGSELSHMRWLIEELRVSLFAQQLGTRERVSAQRLERQWENVRAELREQPAAR